MSKNLVVLCGPPGSGKSTLAFKYEHQGYRYINQDSQGKEHLKYFNEALENSKNIIVDRMNFNKQQRYRYVIPAKEAGYRIEIIVIHEPRQVCFDRMLKRENHPTIKNSTDANNALNTFFSKYERPAEGEADKIKFLYQQENYKPDVVVCDLDGTLCNIDHRLHHVKGEGKKNWKAFFEELKYDLPNEWCTELVEQMSKNYPIVFASGRPDDHRKATVEWLENFIFPTDKLYMRCRGDHRQDYIAKEILLDFEILTRFTPLFFIDDRSQVVNMWRARGFVCLQCAPGDF